MFHGGSSGDRANDAGRKISFRFGLGLALVAGLGVTGAARTEAADDVSFMRQVAPILLKRCSGCHGRRVSEGGYRLHAFTELMSAGESGEAAVVAGKPEASELLRRITASDKDLRMPQEDDALAAIEVALIKRWISEGARFDGRDPGRPLTSQLPPRQHPRSPARYPVAIPVLAIEFSPDGTQIAVGGYHEVTIWQARTGKLVRRLPKRPQRIQSLVWYRPDQILVAGGTPGEYGEVALVSAMSGEVRRVLGTFDDLVLGAAVSDDAKRIAAGSAGHETRGWSMDATQAAWESRVHSDWVTGVAFSADGRFVVSASRDQTLKVHDAASGALFTTYNGHRKQLGKFTGRFAVYAVSFDKRSKRLLSVGEGKAIRVWDPVQARSENGTAADMEGRFFKAGHTRFIPHGFSKATFGLDVHDGVALAGGADGVVREFSVETLETRRTYEGASDWVYAVAAAPTGALVAASGFRGEVLVWNRADGRLVTRFVASPGR